MLRWLRCCCSRSGPSRRVPITRPRRDRSRSSGRCSPSSAARATGSPECAATRLQPVAGRRACSARRSTCPPAATSTRSRSTARWDENYGAGGAPGGANIALTAPGGPITFTYDHATHVISDDLPKRLAAERGAHWLRRGVIAWNLPAGGGLSYRLHVAPDGGLTDRGRRDRGRPSFPLTARPGGPAAGVRATFPHLASYEALRVPGRARRAPRAADRPARRRRLRRRRRARSTRPACRSPACSTTSTRRRTTPSSARPGAGGRADGSRCGRRPPRTSTCCSTRSARRRARASPCAADARRRLAREGRPRLAQRGLRATRSTVYAPTRRRGRDQRRDRPVLAGADHRTRQRSVLVDLDDPALAPRGLGPAAQAALAQPEDSTIYELHVRDFSITDETVPGRASRHASSPSPTRGSDGMRHLRALARAGHDHAAPAAGLRHRHDRGGPRRAAGAGLRPRRRSRPTPSEQQACVDAGRATRTASTGATTRCTTRRPRAPTPPTRTGRRAPASSARWSQGSTAPACAW